MPPLALECFGYTPAGSPIFEPVESPPCGTRLIVETDGAHVDLTCDLPAGHALDGRPKHRAVLDTLSGHFVLWCDGTCTDPCTHPSFLQRVQRSST